MAGLGAGGAVGLAALALCLGSGCSDLAYYRQSVQGHLDLLSRAKPVDEWIAQADTPAALKQRLALAKRMREFSVQVLQLPDNASYRTYADLQRAAAVWNVAAAPALSLQLKTWCYPVTGCVAYRGYFDKAQAEAPTVVQANEQAESREANETPPRVIEPEVERRTVDLPVLPRNAAEILRVHPSRAIDPSGDLEFAWSDELYLWFGGDTGSRTIQASSRAALSRNTTSNSSASFESK